MSPHALVIIPPGGGGTGLPAGYETPGVVHDEIIDCRTPPGGQHPVQYGFAQLNSLAGSLSSGQNVAMVLPAGVIQRWYINVDQTSDAAEIDTDANLPDVHVHLVAPVAPQGAKLTTARSTTGLKPGDAFAYRGTGGWPCRVSHWQFEFMHHEGRQFFDCGPALRADGTTGEYPQEPPGCNVRYMDCDFNDPDDGTPIGGDQRNGRVKWLFLMWRSSLNLVRCYFNVRTIQHLAYMHNENDEDAGMEDCVVEGSIGGQLWQSVARSLARPGPAPMECWTAGGTEGPWKGRGTTRFQGLLADNSFNHYEQAAQAINAIATGRDVQLVDVHLYSFPEESPFAVQIDTHGGLLIKVNSYLDSGVPAGCQSGFWSEREGGKFPPDDDTEALDRPYTCASLVVEGCTFAYRQRVGNSSGKSLITISSVWAGATIRDNAFLYRGNIESTGRGAVEFSEENVQYVGGGAFYFGSADSRVNNVIWNNNNRVPQIVRAEQKFPQLDTTFLQSNPAIKAGVTRASIPSDGSNGAPGHPSGFNCDDDFTATFIEYPLGE
ncbi:MAG: hypothetical protein GY719_31650 [bacterium]|nr:hypothetical protein [bacterium]